MIIRTLLVLLSAHAEDQRTEARALREEVKSIEEEELADRSRRGFRTDPRESVKSSIKSISKASSASKESVKEVTSSNGFAHITIAKVEETKQRTIPPPNRLASYEAEDKIAAEKLLHTTYNREKKTTEAKTSEQLAGMVMIVIIIMIIFSS